MSQAVPMRERVHCSQPLTDAIAERDKTVEPVQKELALQAYAVEETHSQGHAYGQEQLLHQLEQQVGDDVVQPIIALTGEEVALCSQGRVEEGRSQASQEDRNGDQGQGEEVRVRVRRSGSG